MDKGEILKEFSSDPDRYYKVRLFEDKGFERKACTRCGRFFWTLDSERTLCPEEAAPDTYSFIGDPPTSKRFDYTQAWQQTKEFFVGNNHTSVGRYPVVCRWRDDLYFTVASIVDFQRVMGSKVVFEFPANPLVVPQTCLRFKDLENVGVTGRHFSSFCMIGQHSIADSGGYWKDECMDLDFGLLTRQFGINDEEIVFVEDVWAGGGSFGSSLEYYVRGLELGNAVFTEFQGDLGKHTTLDQRIIDMGAGLERFAWITTGSPTAYDCCFGPVLGMLSEMVGTDTDSGILQEYFTQVARALGQFDDLGQVKEHAADMAGLTGGQMDRLIAPLEAVYLVADHLRTLIFAIADGALPSNVGGGYNLRTMLRRINAIAGSRMGVRLDMDELVDAHVDYLQHTYPELDQKRNDIKEILRIESRRYDESRAQMKKKVDRIRQRDEPTADELLTLYESDGIMPEYMVDVGALTQIPSSFYTKLAELHQSGGKDNSRTAEQLPLKGLPPTDALYYGSDPAEFDARVLRVFDVCVVLDRTSFYPRGGGQEPDHGTIGGAVVVDVDKHAGIIVHRLAENERVPSEGTVVKCCVDTSRRSDITMNHTSTHIINASARNVLGSWVWQHSAFKAADHARLDITHHSALTGEQVQAIEDKANQVVCDDIPVSVEHFDRSTAEQKYGFRIYQGGVVPVRSVRIVSIGDMDVEACGGTHVKSTGEIGTIKIIKAKRIQDGVVRLEFVSGATAARQAKDLKKREQKRDEQSAHNKQIRKEREAHRQQTNLVIGDVLQKILSGVSVEEDGIAVASVAGCMRCFTSDTRYDEYFHLKFGKSLINRDQNAVFCGMFDAGPTVRIMVYAGKRSGIDAGEVASKIASVLGGSGGGDAGFAQGGGKDTSKKEMAVAKARSIILQ